jgi:ABC-type cobalamin/Fe3+-siderophores transport system ATPase subunit/predicted  nucleic acid-binding Zn-ribbon protein
MSLNRGSEWGKWDLHVHTPLSFESDFSISSQEREKYPAMDALEGISKPQRHDEQMWAKYIDHLESIDDINCLGITDYFSLEGYELINELRSAGRLDNFDAIFPNIEFRLDTITANSERVNLHVIFSDELCVDDIRKEFLRNLKVTLDEGDERTLRPESLRELGRQAKGYHGDNCSDYYAGCKYARIKFNEIIDELESTSLFSGNYLIVLSGAEWSDINWRGQDAEKRRTLLAKSHALFSNNPNDLKWATGEGDLCPDDFRDEFGSLKPVFSSSDGHDFDSLCEPSKDHYCWIKASHTFQGLKQVVYEPKERLDIASSSPRSFTQIQTIRSLCIENGYVNQQLTIDDVEIPFNSNLVTLIGSQGTGKTALLDFIANCFQDRRNTAIDDGNSFIARIESSGSRLQTEITFEDLEPFTKTALGEPAEFVNGANISYIPQGKIVEYCEQGNRLHNQINDLVTGSANRKSSDTVDEFKSEGNRINELGEKLRRLNAQLHDINPPSVRTELDQVQNELKETETDLDNKESEIDNFKQNHEAELKETEAESLQDELDSLREKDDRLDELERLVNSAKEDLSSIKSFNEQVREIDSQFGDLDIDSDIPEIELDGHRNAIDSLAEDIRVLREDITSSRNDIEDKLGDSTEAEERLADLREERRQIQDTIESLEATVEELEEKLDQVSEARSERTEAFTQYVSAYLRRRMLYKEIIGQFTGDDNGILADVEFEPKIKISDDLVGDLSSLIDMRSNDVNDIRQRVQNLRDIIRDDQPDNVESAVKEYLNAMEEFREETKSSVEPIKFDGTLYDSYLSISEDIFYQGTPMDQLSRGQKGTVLLKIYLAEGDNPLIIDTPEDNLDNRFVYEELIDAIRKAKLNRQIFIATHDANLVVNTDSEQVIISSFDQGEIEYETGPLENPDIRSEAKDILEGGDEAFRRREEKYELRPK